MYIIDCFLLLFMLFIHLTAYAWISCRSMSIHVYACMSAISRVTRMHQKLCLNFLHLV